VYVVWPAGSAARPTPAPKVSTNGLEQSSGRTVATVARESSTSPSGADPCERSSTAPVPALSASVAEVSRSRTTGWEPSTAAGRPAQPRVALVAPFGTATVAASPTWKVPLPLASIQP
jgi:hypothetical protein